MLTVLKFSIIKYKAFPCENSFGINLQYDEKSYQRSMVKFTVKNKETYTTFYVILVAIGSFKLKCIEI